MNKKNEIVLLIILILLFFTINYSWIDGYFVNVFSNADKEDFTVQRVIDGDTIVVGNDTHVRLFGINTPEKGEKYYDEAKKFIEDLILGKTIFIKSFGQDKYYRELGVVFLDDENINSKIIENGFANVYILDDKTYEEEFREAWEKCLETGENLCEVSDDKCANCIELRKLDFENQEIIFYNKCDFACELTNWEIKDEGRKKFIFEDYILGRNQEVEIVVGNSTNSGNNLYWEDETYVWTEEGDTLFLRDSEGKLVLWKYFSD
ncbi:thermonuclease family protein [Candidatus Pacearchaeota archaeon]|jgi:micrococcal nuclease|nr:thermonuclease family protein [Candidatus Pacearchaeota archaeon]